MFSPRISLHHLSLTVNFDYRPRSRPTCPIAVASLLSSVKSGPEEWHQILSTTQSCRDSGFQPITCNVGLCLLLSQVSINIARTKNSFSSLLPKYMASRRQFRSMCNYPLRYRQYKHSSDPSHMTRSPKPPSLLPRLATLQQACVSSFYER
jgi:hypothetical protein